MSSQLDAPHRSPRRRPEQLLLAFFGELVVDREVGPVPASVLIEVLAEHEVASAATRATLARMVARDLLERRPAGRSVSYVLTSAAQRILREARDRVFSPDPFAPEGQGWTLVTYSAPESMRDLRHRVRAQLSWAGFGLLRDGLWIAPGEVDLATVLDASTVEGARRPDGLELLAFRATQVPGFPVRDAVSSAWRLDEIRAHHERFQASWSDVGPEAHAVRDLTALVADWLDLLRTAPRLPAEHLGSDWPAARSVELFSNLHGALATRARVELDERLEP